LRARGLFAAGGGDVDPTTWPHDEFVHAWWVEPGRLLAGEYAGDPDAAHARQKVDLLVDAGGRTFVELTTTADHLEPYDRLVREVADGRRLDLCHISLPVSDAVHADLRHLVVDEYQDVNPAQERLIRLLTGSDVELCVVGDDDQAICQWRGSDVGNIVGFATRYPNVATSPVK